MNAYHRDQQLSDFCDELGSHFPATKDDTTDPATIMESLVDQAESELTITDDVMYDDEDSTEDVEYEPVSQSD
jgi:hypothetical protein